VWKKLRAAFLGAKAAHFHSNWLMREFAGSNAEYRKDAAPILHLLMDNQFIQMAQDIALACRYSE
jgi:hypothetical protein